MSYLLGEGSGCRIYNNSPSEFSIGAMTFSQTYSLATLSDAAKAKYHFENYTVFLNKEYFLWYHSLYNDFDLIIN
jgi:hypothetical protein